ncbi:S-layer homology domain-containing protein, partial [Candidatus Margulisiibacteriota bacterium]
SGTGNGIDNNLTFGVGFWNDDFGFDYAYHQYGPIDANTTHYLSFSYGYPWERYVAPATKEVVPVEYLKINTPHDKSIIYVEDVLLTAEVLKDDVVEVEVNDKRVEVTWVKQEGRKMMGIFSIKVKIPTTGKSPIKVKCFDKDGKLLKMYKVRLVRLPSFKDVPKGYWARSKVNLLAMLKLFGGYPDGTFKPENGITRAELTTLLVRAMGVDVPPVKGKIFKDLSSKHWSAKYVKVGVDRGIVTGYRDGTFKPSKKVNRTEGLIMIARFAGIQPTAIVRQKPFPDVPAVHWAAKMIDAAKGQGLLDYLKGHIFKPKADLTRAEAAEIISQTQFVQEKEGELFDWEVGFD